MHGRRGHMQRPAMGHPPPMMGMSLQHLSPQMSHQMGGMMGGVPMMPAMQPQYPMLMYDQGYQHQQQAAPGYPQQNVGAASAPYQMDFMNKANRPYIEVRQDEKITAVVAIFNYAARSPEEITFEVGKFIDLFSTDQNLPIAIVSIFLLFL